MAIGREIPRKKENTRHFVVVSFRQAQRIDIEAWRLCRSSIWSSQSPRLWGTTREDDGAAARALEGFASILNLAYFKDAELDKALADFRGAMKGLPAAEKMYVAISRALGNVEMNSESEAVMLRALDVYPNSRYIRFELGKLYVTLNRREQAIDIFEQAGRMDDPFSSPLADAFQRSLIYRSLGNAEEALFRFDEAVASYKLALEIMPGNVEALVALADLLLRTSEVDEAAERYSEAIERDPVNAEARCGLAEGHLRRGRFGDAAAQAAIALKKDPFLRKARYVRAMALIRSGKKEEGQKELEAYARSCSE